MVHTQKKNISRLLEFIKPIIIFFLSLTIYQNYFGYKFPHQWKILGVSSLIVQFKLYFTILIFNLHPSPQDWEDQR